MANIIKKEDFELANAISKSDLSTLINPLVKEIYLFGTRVAGTTHIKNQDIFLSLKVGDKLTLIREDNSHDSKAIIVQTENKDKIGYIPMEDNIIFSRLMDAGKLLTSKIKKLDKKNKWNIVDIDIYLLDF